MSSKHQKPRSQKPKQTKTSSKHGKTEGAAIAYGQKQRFRGPNIPQTRVVKNSEMIETVSGTQALTVSRFLINPGSKRTFPWLSSIADSFEKYRFRKLSFRYVTRTGTTSPGSIILSPDYDPDDPIPQFENSLTNTQDAVEDAVWREVVCHLNPKSLNAIGPYKTIRSDGEIGSSNSKGTFDSGNFHIASVGCTPDTTVVILGKLWVDYEVELNIPQTPTTPNINFVDTNVSSYTLTCPLTIGATSPANYFGGSNTNPWVESPASDNLGIALVQTVPGVEATFTLPRGNFMAFLTVSLSENGLFADTNWWGVTLDVGGVLGGKNQIAAHYNTLFSEDTLDAANQSNTFIIPFSSPGPTSDNPPLQYTVLPYIHCLSTIQVVQATITFLRM